MPDVIDALRNIGGPDRAPSYDARRVAAARLQQEIDRERRPRAALLLGRAPTIAVASAAAVAVAITTGIALIPTSGPGADKIIERAAAAVTAQRAQILTADIHGMQLRGDSREPVGDYGVVRVWIRQLPGQEAREFRSLALKSGSPGAAHAGDETATYSISDPSMEALPFTTATYDAAADELRLERGVKAEMSPELFQASSLLKKARAGHDVELERDAYLDGRPVYKLSWSETDPRASASPVHTDHSLWVDRDTYAPLQLVSRDVAAGRDPVDETYKAVITNFGRLPDTPANRRLLKMSDHPGAKQVTSPIAPRQP